MAYVLVQHLDPRHKSMLTELLSRASTLPIHEVSDGMRVEPDHVYIIPPMLNSTSYMVCFCKYFITHSSLTAICC